MRTLRATLLLTLTLVSASSAVAQDSWPDRPIRFVVTSAAGGGIDLMARILADGLSRQLPQRVIIENSSGAGGLMATRAVAKSDPDGYTFLFQGPGMVTLPFLHRNPGYDARADFAGVSLVNKFPMLLVTSPKSPAKDLGELIAMAKADPDKFSFGSSGVGGASHIPLAKLMELANIKMVHVPFRGSGDATTALMGGQVDLVIDQLAMQLGYAREGRVRALGVSTKSRSPFAPDVPSISETLPGFEYFMWVAVFAPAKTPGAIVDKMSSAIALALKDPAVQKRYSDLMVEPVGSTPKELESFVAEQMIFNQKIIESANIKPVE